MERLRGLLLIVDTIDEEMTILKTCNINVSSWGSNLTYICSSKFSKNTLWDWEKSLNNHKEMLSWKHDQFSQDENQDVGNCFPCQEVKLEGKFRVEVKRISFPNGHK